eukprot:g2724.t1
MGKIDRVWITVDNTLYLWHYTSASGNNWDIYDGLDQVIVSVALVKPKPGVFDHQYVKHSSTVEYVLVIATTVEVVVLTVSFRGIGPSGKIEIHSSGFTIPSDDVSMHHVVGTPSGRIFMGGRDGNLYELFYRRSTGFMQMVGLRRDCWIENHTMSALPQLVPLSVRHKVNAVGESVDLAFDADRQIVYLLVEEDSESACCGVTRGSPITRSVIHAFYLGACGTKLVRLGRTPLGVMEAARAWARGSTGMASRNQLGNIFAQRTLASRRNRDEQLSVRKLVVVRPSESHKVHLLAVSERGIRFYFATSDLDRAASTWGWSAASKATSTVPTQLRLVYVRMPPPVVRRVNIKKSGNEDPLREELYKPAYSKDLDAQVAFYSHGVLLLPHATKDRSSLVAITPHPATLAEIRIDPTAATAQLRQQERIGSVIVGQAAFNPGNRGMYGKCPRNGLQERVSFLSGQDMKAKESRILDIAECPFYDGVLTATPSVSSARTGEIMTKNIRDHILNADGRNGGSASTNAGGTRGTSSSSSYASLASSARRPTTRKRDLTALYGVSTGKMENALQKGALKGGGDALVLSPLAAQMCRVQRPHDLLLLTANGLRRIHRFTAIEQMQEALSTCPISVAMDDALGGAGDRLTQLFQIYGYDEGCAMCVQIACTMGKGGDAKLTRCAASYARNDGIKSGGEFPSNLVNQASRAGTRPAERVRRCASDALRVFGGIPRIADAARSGGVRRSLKPATSGSVALFETEHSFRFNGLCIYVARLLRPFWTHSLTIPSGSNPQLRECRFDSDELALLQEPLQYLCNYMKRSDLFKNAVEMNRSNLFKKRPSDMANANVHDRLIDGYLPSHADSRDVMKRKAQDEEQRKIHFLYQLVRRAKEALGLFRILLAPSGSMLHKSKSLNGVLSRISPKMKRTVLQNLSTFSWAFLVTQYKGKQLMGVLVEATMNGESAEDAARMAKRLTMECSCFYSPIEQGLLRVQERLKFAKECDTATSSQQAMSMSEQTLVEAAKRLRERVKRHGNDELTDSLRGVILQYRKKLRRACFVYAELGAVARIQKVALKAGAMFASCTNDDISRPRVDISAADTEASASSSIAVVQNGQRRRRLRAELRKSREKCYETVISCLEQLMRQARELPEIRKTSTKTLGFGDRNGGAKFEPPERREQVDLLLNLSLQSNDRWFHEMVYDFFFKKLKLENIRMPARRDQVLTAKTRYHRDYLHQYARQLYYEHPPAAVSTIDDDVEDEHFPLPLIYTFFLKNKLDIDAAEVLRNLAMFEGSVGSGGVDRYPIHQRLHYLVCALEHLRRVAHEARGDVVRLLQNVQDDVDIARRQVHILRRMSERYSGQTSWAGSDKLRYMLLDVTTLYNDYARPNKLWEDCLAILHECNHRGNVAELQRVWNGLLSLGHGAKSAGLPELLFSMGREYYSKRRSFVFPVEYICGTLENNVGVEGAAGHEQRFSEANDWVIKMMRSIPVSFEDLLDVYLNLRKKETQSLRKVRLLFAIGSLFSAWNDFLADPRAQDDDKLYVRQNADRILQHIQAVISELTHHSRTVDDGLRQSIESMRSEMRETQKKIKLFCRDAPSEGELRLFYGHG